MSKIIFKSWPEEIRLIFSQNTLDPSEGSYLSFITRLFLNKYFGRFNNKNKNSKPSYKTVIFFWFLLSVKN